MNRGIHADNSTAMEKRSVFYFTPSATARQNYLYVQHAGVTEAPSDSKMSFSHMESYLMLFSRGGKGEVTVDDKTYVCGPDQLLLADCRGNVSCRNVGSDVWEYDWFCINSDNFDIYYEQYAPNGRPVLIPVDDTLGALRDGLLRFISGKPNPQTELNVSCILTRIITELISVSYSNCPDKRTTPEYVAAIMDWMGEHFTEQISLDSVAENFGLSKYHLSREFKRYTRYSPNEYVISLRLNYAKELLRSTDHPLSEIAAMVGCGDVNHFIQLFKSRENVTPAVFRKMGRM